MSQLDGTSFNAPATQHDFAALLFDMDGTIIDSTAAIVKHWRALGKEIGVDGDFILQTSHGRRSIDVLAQHAPHLATWEHIVPMEAQIPHSMPEAASEIPGARALLARLAELRLDNSNSSSTDAYPIWAIVTSGTAPLVQGWLSVLGLAQPQALVSAEQVARGKPDPMCYAQGAQRVGMLQAAVKAGAGQTGELADGGEAGAEGEGREGEEAHSGFLLPSEVLVLEDSPAGIRAGKSAGFRVLAVATTHGVTQLGEAGADWVVRDLRSVRVVGWDGKRGVVGLEIADGLVM